LNLFLQNPDIRSRFEKNLGEKCPLECEQKYWEVDLLSAEVEKKVNLAFFPLLTALFSFPHLSPFLFFILKQRGLNTKRPTTTIVFVLGLTQCCGSGNPVPFLLRDPGWVKIQDPDPG
jgi:hypothetical protein